MTLYKRGQQKINLRTRNNFSTEVQTCTHTASVCTHNNNHKIVARAQVDFLLTSLHKFAMADLVEIICKLPNVM